MTAGNLRRLAERGVQAVALAGGYALLVFAFLVGVEVIARKFLGLSLRGVDEIGGYVLAGATAFGLSYALLCGAHTRMELLLPRLPALLRAPLNAAALVVTAGFGWFMAWQAIATLRESLHFQARASTPLQTPLWLPQSVWVAGLVLFALVATVLAVLGLARLLRGDAAGVDRLWSADAARPDGESR